MIGRYDWRSRTWTPGMGRGGYVQQHIKRLPRKDKAALCRHEGHPVHAIEPFTWMVEGKERPGHLCRRCFARVDLSRLLYPKEKT